MEMGERVHWKTGFRGIVQWRQDSLSKGRYQVRALVVPHYGNVDKTA